MAHAKALVNPKLLRWARERAGLTLDGLSDRLHLPAEQVTSWEAGEAHPTMGQAQKVANLTQTPFGYLYLNEPPSEPLPIPDLRTVGSGTPTEVSSNLRDVVRDVMQKVFWYAEYLQDIGARDRLPFVGSFNLTASVLEVAANIERQIPRPQAANGPDEFLRILAARAESVGVLVMRSGIVGNNTHRPLNVGEFRGFAIADPYTPSVFVNSADAPAARVFTLAHELAHIWIGSSGISDATPSVTRVSEVFCNAIAGEYLVPEAAFKECWRSDLQFSVNLQRVTTAFHVSRVVAARRALAFKFASSAEYQSIYASALSEYEDKESGGGDFYRTARVRNGDRMSRAVVQQARSGRLLLRDAGRLLGVQPSSIDIYAKALQS